MRKSVIPFKDIGQIELPADLADEVVALLWDPRAQRIRYGSMRRLCYRLFSNWVEEQRAQAMLNTDSSDIPPIPNLE